MKFVVKEGLGQVGKTIYILGNAKEVHLGAPPLV